MRVSGSTPPLPPAVHHARSSGRPDASGPAEAAPPPAPVSIPETPEPDAPAETGKAHGLVRAAEHSHRSDVAALRQWINHPDLRSDLSLPDLSTEHKGNGFQKAVAAYEAIIAIGNPAPSTDPVADPTPTTDPAPTADPAPTTDPALYTDPVPTTDPALYTDPALSTDPVPSADPAPVPNPVATDPALAIDPAPAVDPSLIIDPVHVDDAPAVEPDPLLEALLPEAGSGDDA